AAPRPTRSRRSSGGEEREASLIAQLGVIVRFPYSSTRSKVPESCPPGRAESPFFSGSAQAVGGHKPSLRLSATVGGLHEISTSKFPACGRGSCRTFGCAKRGEGANLSKPPGAPACRRCAR